MKARSIFALALAALGGCTTFEPYETLPLQVPGDPRPRVGICYDELISDASEIQKAAEDACGPGMTAVRESSDLGLASLQLCPALLPGRATFVCTKR